jgi:hypothetical protein
MSGPIVFISRNRIKGGMLDDFRAHYRESVPLTKVAKPGTLVQLAYLNEDATEVTVVRFFPNAEAMDRQLQGADERSKLTYQFIEPTRIEIYGRPSRFALEMMKQVAGSGIEVTIDSDYIGGFTRLGAEATSQARNTSLTPGGT